MQVPDPDRRAVLNATAGLSVAAIVPASGCLHASNQPLASGETSDQPTATDESADQPASSGEPSGPPAYTSWIPADDDPIGYVYVNATGEQAVISQDSGVELSAATPVAAASPMMGVRTIFHSEESVLASALLDAPEGSLLSGTGVGSALRLGESLVLEGGIDPDAVVDRLGDGFSDVETIGEYTIYERTDPVIADIVRDEGDVVAVGEDSLVVDLESGVERVRTLVETRTGERDRRVAVDTAFAAATAVVGDAPAVQGSVGRDQRLLAAADDSFETTHVTITGLTLEDDSTGLLSTVRADGRDAPDAETASTVARTPVGDVAGLSIDADDANVSLDSDGLGVDVGDDVSVDLNDDGVSVDDDDTDVDVGSGGVSVGADDDTAVDVGGDGVSVDADDDTAVDVGSDGVSVGADDTAVDVGSDGISVDADDDTAVDVGSDGVSVDADDTDVDVGADDEEGAQDSDVGTADGTDERSTDIEVTTDGRRIDVTVDW